MALKIAIQPDAFVHTNGERQSFSERWTKLSQDAGIEPVPVDVFAPDIMEQIAACDAFMWRPSPTARPREYAKRLLYAVEAGMGKPLFPSLKSWWHFEDKVIQYYFFAAAGIPTLVTNIFWDQASAERFCDTADYPFVLKLAIGYRGQNVRLVHNRREAQHYIEQLFGPGVTSLAYGPAPASRLLLRRLRIAKEAMRGRNPNTSTSTAELQHGYFYAQKFLPGNDFDTRITVTGDRAFIFRRHNRPDDFRASGSGRFDWDPSPVGEDAVRLAYKVARKLQAQTVGVDILRRDGEPVITELTLTYAGWCVRDCPGHWTLVGTPESGTLHWVEGSMLPEDAIFEDFLAEIAQTKDNAPHHDVVKRLLSSEGDHRQDHQTAG
jgi:glutathione synthase/RimK-type ligase-like ATP-grasp enzyme